jgi:hypothetical protein
LIGEYLATLDATRRQRLLDDADASRRFVAALPAFQAGSAVLRPIKSKYVSVIQADPLFLQVFGIRPHQFAYLDLGTLIALQPWVEPRLDPIPTTENELMDFALPNNWDVPAEVSFIAPMGPIQILTSSPSFGGLRMEFDAATATVKLGAPKHLNLIQVIHFAGRYYLVNGYHRVTDALAANVHELPALVTQTMSLQDVQLPGMGPFNAGYVQSLPRPPLVSDFTTAASIAAKMRERRLPVLRAFSFVYMLPPLPRRSDWVPLLLNPPAVATFPERVTGSVCASSFSRFAQRSLALRPAHSRCHRNS